MTRLYNCDCRMKFNDILKDIKKQIIIVTDPPFNIGYHYNSYNDKMNDEDYYNMLVNLFKNYPSVVIHYPENLYKLALKLNKSPIKVVSWVYNSNTGKQHRDIAFFDIKPDFNKVKQPYKNPNDKRIKERIARGIRGGRLYDWWNINQIKNVSHEKTAHPCQMPLEVMKNIIGILPDDCVIVDPFMGSGTTGVAVNEMNKVQNVARDFIGFEIDKTYFEIASNRINNSEWSDLD